MTLIFCNVFFSQQGALRCTKILSRIYRRAIFYEFLLTLDFLHSNFSISYYTQQEIQTRKAEQLLEVL
jgi:hypothetical protein